MLRAVIKLARVFGAYHYFLLLLLRMYGGRLAPFWFAGAAGSILH